MDKEVKWLLTNGAKPVPGTKIRWCLGETMFIRRGLNRWEVLSRWLYELKVNRVWASPEAALAWLCAYREKQNVEFHEDVGKYVSPRALARGRGILTRQHKEGLCESRPKSKSTWEKMEKKECEKAILFNCPSCGSDSNFFRKIERDGGLLIKCGSCETIWLELQQPEELKQSILELRS